MGMVAQGWQHGDGSMGMVAWGWQYGMVAWRLQNGDGSLEMVAWGQQPGVVQQHGTVAYYNEKYVLCVCDIGQVSMTKNNVYFKYFYLLKCKLKYFPIVPKEMYSRYR